MRKGFEATNYLGSPINTEKKKYFATVFKFRDIYFTTHIFYIIIQLDKKVFQSLFKYLRIKKNKHV